MIKFFEILILFFNLFSLIYSEIGGDTKECLEKVNKGDCGAFISCCNSKCNPNQNQNHKCFAFMDEIQKDQTFCFCSTPTINNNPSPPSQFKQTQQKTQNQQSFNKLFDDSFPSKSLFSLNNEDNSKSSSSSSSSSSFSSFNNLWKSPSSLFGFSSIPSSSPQNNFEQKQNNIFNSSFFTKTTEKQFGNQQQQFQNNPSSSPSPRPNPGNPSDGRHLFLTTTQTSSAIGLKKIINKKDGNSLIGQKMDFVGGIILLFVFDLLLLSLTI